MKPTVRPTMRRNTIIALAVSALALGSVSGVQALDSGAGSGHDDHMHMGHDGTADPAQLKELKQATASYRKVSNAIADGYGAFAIPPEVGGTPTTGLGLVGDPTCFDSASGGMGVHYVKGIDGTLNVTQPEALVYSVNEHGRLQLVAVEYIVPASLVDPANPPMLFGQHLHPHSYLPVWVLHVWAWKSNPNGIFADFNPRVAACPVPSS
ncbi:MAG: hypothetical protein RLZZ623_2592 [Actinomycetota bacterium]